MVKAAWAWCLPVVQHQRLHQIQTTNLENDLIICRLQYLHLKRTRNTSALTVASQRSALFSLRFFVLKKSCSWNWKKGLHYTYKIYYIITSKLQMSLVTYESLLQEKMPARFCAHQYQAWDGQMEHTYAAKPNIFIWATYIFSHNIFFPDVCRFIVERQNADFLPVRLAVQ